MADSKNKTIQTNILIPIIRKVMPQIMASAITGVQSMLDIPEILIETGESWVDESTIEYYWVKAIPFALFHKNSGFGLSNNEKNEVLAWCIDAFGEPSDQWKVIDNTYYFKDEGDRTLFLLKWNTDGRFTI